MRIIFLTFLFITFLFSDDILSKQDIKKMIAKMVILGFQGTSVDENSQIYKDIKANLGGVILFDKDPNDKTKAKNIVNKKQLQQLIKNLQKISKQKLLISIDQEGGVVQRLKTEAGFVNTLSAFKIANKGEEFAKSSYKALSLDLKSVGINLNFAPVVDLAINEKNQVLVKKERAYSSNSDIVIKYADIFMKEQKNQNIISVLKHFPGHGSSLADSHLGFVDISKTWNKKELEPFKYFISNKSAKIIMTAHVFNINLDKNYPATLSYNVNTKLLREELKYDGVLISDDMQMSAISKHYDLKQSVTLAINSGVDILLFANQLTNPISLEKIVSTIYSQILNEQISLERIIESNRRINRLLEELN